MNKNDHKLRMALYERALRRFNETNLSDPSFQQQTEFFRDKAKFISACCSRRAGKSVGLAKKLIQAAQKFPGSMIPYISLTRKAANNIMFPTFKELNEQYKLALVMKEHRSEVWCPNGAKIAFFGADSSGLTERLRGPKYPIVAIDEAQSYKIDLENLVFDILSPAVADYSKEGFGQIIMAGTPGRVPSGFFYETQMKSMKFSKHSWTVFENPYFPNPQEYLDMLLEAKNVTIDHPTIQREWFAKWVKDDSALVYHLSKKNLIEGYQPTQHNFYVLGFDLGFNPDPTAFTLVTYNRYEGRLVVLKSYSKSELTVTEVGDEIEKFRHQFPNLKIVGDVGALGKMVAEELRKRFGLAITPADKRGKIDFINILNDDLRNERIHLVTKECKELIDEMETLQFDGLEVRKREDPRFKNDCADSFLYAWRFCYHYIKETLHEQTIEETIEAEIEKQITQGE
jgi:phage terminase large subunit